MSAQISVERYARIKEVYQTAVELGVSEQTEFLAAACTGDEPLRAEVAALLRARSEAGEFLEVSALDVVGEVCGDESRDALLGKQIGRYRALRRLGSGGMGVVYLAERADGEFNQLVAVKLIKRGMDTDLIVRRFRHERQILAALDHPNIAGLIDGGTTADGLPYFVMEYVEGIPINRFCKDNDLSISARLDLFREICAAVEYAHRNLLVHRDLKPSNILVTSDGKPKLLDFGIAKLLTDGELNRTETEFRPMTPDYASPEQMRGETATAAADVYSLGVILYEILVGARPFATGHDISEAARVVCEVEPPKPSDAAKRKHNDAAQTNGDAAQSAASAPHPRRTAASLLRGDLDNIVLKALRKEPERRYSSVEAFSEDVRRYLRRLPVLAQPDTFRYRTTKYIRRNRTLVIAAGLVVMSLVGGIASTSWQAIRAERERARAERRFDDVRQMANSFMFEFHDAIDEMPGSTPVRQLMVKRALEYLDGLASEASDNVGLQRDLAAAYIKVGDVQGRPNMANLGDTAGAMESYCKAATILEEVSAIAPDNLDTQRDLSLALDNISRIQIVSRDYQAALDTTRRVLAMREKLLAEKPDDAEYRRLVGDGYRRIGDALGEIASKTGDTTGYAAQLENYRQALAVHQDLLLLNPTGKLERRAQASNHQRIGSTLNRIGKATGNKDHFQQAIENQQRALELWIQSDPADPEGRFPAGQYKHIGSTQLNAGDAVGALANFDKARPIFEKLVAGDADSKEYQRELAYLQLETAKAFAKLNDKARAAANYDQALQTLETLANSDPFRAADNYQSLTNGYQAAGELYELTKTAKTLAYYRKALDYGEKWLEVAPDNDSLRAVQAELSLRVARHHAKLAATSERANKYEREENYLQSCAWSERSLTNWLKLKQQIELSPLETALADEAVKNVAVCQNSEVSF